MALVETEVAGDPVTGRRWIQRSVRKLERERARRGMRLGKSVVQRVLRAAGVYPKANVKRLTPRPHPERDRPFRSLTHLCRPFERRGDPVLRGSSRRASCSS
jgi:hypothetical protein